MPAIEDVLLNRKERRLFCGLLLVICILSIALAIIGWTQCVCHWTTTPNCPKALPFTRVTTVPSTTLPINFTHAVNCSQGTHLGQFTYIHICWYGSGILIDIRQFSSWSGKATAKGIGLGKAQWHTLLQHVKDINSTIVDKEFHHRIFRYSDWHA